MKYVLDSSVHLCELDAVQDVLHCWQHLQQDSIHHCTPLRFRLLYTMAAVFMHATTYSSTFRLKQGALSAHVQKAYGASQLIHDVRNSCTIVYLRSTQV